MEKKDIDWGNLGFGYVKTDYRYVSNYKNGAWDEGGLTTDDTVTILVKYVCHICRPHP